MSDADNTELNAAIRGVLSHEPSPLAQRMPLARHAVKPSKPRTHRNWGGGAAGGTPVAPRIDMNQTIRDAKHNPYSPVRGSGLIVN